MTTGSNRMSLNCRAPERKKPHGPLLPLIVPDWPFEPVGPETVDPE